MFKDTLRKNSRNSRILEGINRGTPGGIYGGILERILRASHGEISGRIHEESEENPEWKTIVVPKFPKEPEFFRTFLRKVPS